MQINSESPSASDLVKGYNWIVVCNGYLGGRPSLISKRISVSQVLEMLSNGFSTEDLERDYDVSKEETMEILRYASEVLGESRVAS